MKTISILACLFVAVAFVSAQNMVAPAEQELKKLNQEISQLANRKKFSEALPIAKKAAKLAKAKLGDKNLEYAKTLHTLGYLYIVLDKNAEAEDSLENALKVYGANSNTNDLQIGLLESLSSLKYKNNDYKKAENFLERAIELRERTNDPDSAKLTANLWSLANINYAVKNFKKSAGLYRRVFDIRKEQPDSTESDMLDAYTRSYCSLYKAGKSDEAESFENKFFDKVFKTGKVLKIDFFNVKAIELPFPKYPVVAGKFDKEGQVKVLAVIDENGDVIFSCAKTGEYYFGFVNAAEKAAYRAKFAPNIINGEKVKAVTTITYNFFNR